MGSFSFTKADNLTKVSNIVYNKPFKFLIPAIYGGGFIKDRYQDYGYLGHNDDGSPRYDMYELLAIWNNHMLPAGTLKHHGDILLMNKQIDEFTQVNRSFGIDLHFSEKELKYPLKLVSASYTGTYEDCDGQSGNDPAQGFSATLRKSDDWWEWHR